MKNTFPQYHPIYLFLVGLLFVGLPLAAWAQDEVALIHTDKSFYVNGEVIWYSLYLPGELSDQSISVKAVVFNERGREVDYVFHQTDGKGQIEGYYKVPFDARTGWYRLAFRGLQADNMDVHELGDVLVPIYNDNDSRRLQADMVELPQQQETARVLSSAELAVRLRLEQAEHQPRDAVSLTIEVVDDGGQAVPAVASVAVTNWSLVAPALGTYAGVTTADLDLPEAPLLDQWYKRIKIVDEDNTPRLASVIGVWSGEEQRMFFSSRTNTGGVSLLRLPAFSGRKSIQYLGYEKESPNLYTREIPESAAAISQELLVTPGLLTYLEKSQQRKKIFQYYNTLEFDVQPAPPEFAREELKPNQTFRVNDYESFDNFATFFQENLSPLRFLEDRENNRYTAYMYNPRNNRRNNEYDGRPLFIIDGKATRNADFIGRLDLAPIKEVELFFRPEQMREYFNVMGNSGVVNITLQGEDRVQLPSEDEQNHYAVSGFQRQANFPVFAPDQLAPRQPFFRPQLFWTAGVQLKSSGPETIRFVQSDAIGTFRIEVVVQDEQGRRGYQTLFYEVKPAAE